jgi:hypothetical protein
MLEHPPLGTHHLTNRGESAGMIIHSLPDKPMDGPVCRQQVLLHECLEAWIDARPALRANEETVAEGWQGLLMLDQFRPLRIPQRYGYLFPRREHAVEIPDFA